MPPSPDPRIDAYLSNNRKWASSPTYTAPIPFPEMQAKGRAREDGTLIVVACTDPRCTPEEFLGMSTTSNNKATIVRVAGGRVQSALGTLLVLAAVGNQGQKGTIMVIHHTDCGLATADDEDIRRCMGVYAETEEEGQLLMTTRFGAFEDPVESVKEDVRFLRRSSFFKRMMIWGGVQDTGTGVVEDVVVD